MGIKNVLGQQFDEDDLRSLRADGHELATHTFSHVSSRSLDVAQFRNEVRRGREAIRELTGENPSPNFAYPYGEATVQAKKFVGQDALSCRGTHKGINGPDVDLNFLRANQLYGGVEEVGRVKELVSANREQKGWLIFYTHDVSEKPSPYGCTPALLAEALVLAVDSGAKVLGVMDVLRGWSNCDGEAFDD
jgi:peptidoglycan/xylan/chitin deacetylase (PgdA/CDA1 family)